MDQRAEPTLGEEFERRLVDHYLKPTKRVTVTFIGLPAGASARRSMPVNVYKTYRYSPIGPEYVHTSIWTADHLAKIIVQLAAIYLDCRPRDLIISRHSCA